jgi:hypothetical protein
MHEHEHEHVYVHLGIERILWRVPCLGHPKQRALLFPWQRGRVKLFARTLLTIQEASLREFMSDGLMMALFWSLPPCFCSPAALGPSTVRRSPSAATCITSLCRLHSSTTSALTSAMGDVALVSYKKR